jgi:hypothetical protein
MALLHGRAGRLTALFGGLRPGRSCAIDTTFHPNDARGPEKSPSAARAQPITALTAGHVFTCTEPGSLPSATHLLSGVLAPSGSAPVTT